MSAFAPLVRAKRTSSSVRGLTDSGASFCALRQAVKRFERLACSLEMPLQPLRTAAKRLVASASLPPLTMRRRELRPEHVALLGACEAPLHDAFVGLAGAGQLGTTSASPSITFAASPACAANMALIAAIACSSSSSVRSFTPPECSSFISLGTKSAQIFMYAAGCCLRTFSIAAAPCFLKSAASASRKSLLNDLRVASKEPPGFPDHPGANLPLMRLGE